jgi:hypothetical protein
LASPAAPRLQPPARRGSRARCRCVPPFPDFFSLQIISTGSRVGFVQTPTNSPPCAHCSVRAPPFYFFLRLSFGAAVPVVGWCALPCLGVGRRPKASTSRSTAHGFCGFVCSTRFRASCFCDDRACPFQALPVPASPLARLSLFFYFSFYFTLADASFPRRHRLGRHLGPRCLHRALEPPCGACAASRVACCSRDMRSGIWWVLPLCSPWSGFRGWVGISAS